MCPPLHLSVVAIEKKPSGHSWQQLANLYIHKYIYMYICKYNSKETFLLSFKYSISVTIQNKYIDIYECLNWAKVKCTVRKKVLTQMLHDGLVKNESMLTYHKEAWKMTLGVMCRDLGLNINTTVNRRIWFVFCITRDVRTNLVSTGIGKYTILMMKTWDQIIYLPAV